MLFSAKGGGAKPCLKPLSHGHYGEFLVSEHRYRHLFEYFRVPGALQDPKNKYTKDNVGWAFSPTMKLCWGRNPNLQKAIYSVSRKATRHARRGLVHKAAFTLAEVLITLGIIGIVAAMTLPTVISKTQDKQFKTMFKKQYSAMTQALLMTFESGDDIPSLTQENWSDMIFYVCKIASQLKYVDAGLNCKEIEKLGNSSDVDNVPIYTNNVTWHKTNEWYNKQGVPQDLDPGYWNKTFELADGAWINFNCFRNIFVDVNGKERPNTIGRDIFYFKIPVGALRTDFFSRNPGDINNVNGCSGNFGVSITPENYRSDCENGSGWGCSPLYILN